MELSLRNSSIVINREQGIYIIGAVILLAGLFFGLNTVPSTQKTFEKSKVHNTQKFDIHSLQSLAKQELKKEEISYIEALETQVQYVTADSSKLRLLKELSGSWFQLGNPILSGIYARQIAEITGDAQSWSITGTTFAAALSNDKISEENRVIARDLAVEAFENAISLEPAVIEHRVNQALCFIETPDVEQPMKGVQMLAALATKYPESALPPYHLARLAVKTGQMERAEDRIGQALRLDSTNSRIACLAIDIYTAVQKNQEAEKLKVYCRGTN